MSIFLIIQELMLQLALTLLNLRAVPFFMMQLSGSKNYKNKVLFTSKKKFLNCGFDIIVPVTDFSNRKGTYVNIENRVQLSNNPLEKKSYFNDAWHLISKIAENFDGSGLKFSNYEDIYTKMISSVESFSGLKNHNLALESYIIPIEFKPKFVYKDDSNEFDSDLIRVYEGRVLIKDNDSFEIKKDGDTNYIKDEIQFNISKDNGRYQIHFCYGWCYLFIGKRDYSGIIGETFTGKRLQNNYIREAESAWRQSKCF